MSKAGNIVKTVLKPLASLRLTVALLIMSMIVIFAGTWAQIDHGIWDVQARYFHSYFTWIDFQLFLPRPNLAAGEKPFPGALPMLGGYSLIILLLLNLLAAHTVRFKLSWKRSGVILIHLGLIMLLVGELVTSQFAVESQMPIDEGSYSNYSQDIRESELAIVEHKTDQNDNVTVIPESKLTPGVTISDSRLPFDVKVDEFYGNSRLLGPMQVGPSTPQPRATAGDGVGLALQGRPIFGGVQGSQVDSPSAYVSLSKSGQPLGTYLVSLWMDKPQTVTVDGKPYDLALRFKRIYKPYTVHLKDFTAEYYPGTDKPKRYESQVRLVDPSRGVDRDIRIFMNSPLRYHGETFFQASFISTSADRPWETTVLQVVDNPGWMVPYLACLVGAVGMLVHFSIVLTNFLKRELAAPAVGTVGAMRAQGQSPSQPAGKAGNGNGGKGKSSSYVLQPKRPFGGAALLFPAGILAVCLLYVVSTMRPANPSSPFDVDTFAKIPLQHQGRIQPLDSLATNSLRIISGKAVARVGEGDAARKLTPAQWLLDVFANPRKAHSYKVFRIDHPDVKALLEVKDLKEKYFSVNQIMLLDDPSEERRMERLKKLQAQADAAAKVDPKSRDLYQSKVAELGQHLQLYMTLQQIESLGLVPPETPGAPWRPIGDVARAARDSGGQMDPHVRSFLTILDHYADGRTADFNRDVKAYRATVAQDMPRVDRKASLETFFNGFAPFYVCMLLYGIVFALAALSWLGWRTPLARGAMWVLLLALALHTFGLAARMYIMGRPAPVTNLYSSAVYVGWFAVVLAVGFELVFRNSLGSFAASVVGFVTLIIAHHLAGDGDTMEMLQAVLDTNLWLATHVTLINMGYTAVALTGVFGMVYVLMGVFTKWLDVVFNKLLSQMIYGASCFGIFFAFVGTILGGIWADQSWGRFWGWDPKENGAALVVLWTAVILHARWGGVVRERGLACMAIFGNVMLAWSWFGTNMLGVGLHAYGFMDSAVFWMGAFVLSQIGLIALALAVPQRMWRSSAVLGRRQHAFTPTMKAQTT